MTGKMKMKECCHERESKNRVYKNVCLEHPKELGMRMGVWSTAKELDHPRGVC